MVVLVEIPTAAMLEAQQIRSWPIWEKEKSSFHWDYDEKETCYFLEGVVEVELADGSRVKIKKGDLVTFPKGLACTWHIKEKVKKHYKFG